MKIKVYVETRKVGSRCSQIIEVPDDADEDLIEELAYEAMWEMVDWNWKEVNG